MESEIKIGQQFEFAIHADTECRQKAVVTQVLSNREEGIGPEADYYIADWIEARTLSEQPKALVFVLANDGNVYLDGEWVDIIVDLAAYLLRAVRESRELKGICRVVVDFRRRSAGVASRNCCKIAITLIVGEAASPEVNEVIA